MFRREVLLPLDVLKTADWRSELPSTDEPARNPEITDAIWRTYPGAVSAARAGAALQWEPGAFNGVPAFARGEFFGNPLFHALSSSLSPPRALALLALAYLLIGSFGAFLLLRECGASIAAGVVAAVCFTYNGYLLGWLSILEVAGSMFPIALMFLFFERALRRNAWRHCLAAGACFAFQVSAGWLLWAAYAALALTGVTLIRVVPECVPQRSLRPFLRPLSFAVLTLGFGAALAAPWLLPTMELYGFSSRAEPLGAGSRLRPGELLRIVAPYLYGSPLDGQRFCGYYAYPETDLYFGVLPLLLLPLGVAGRERRVASAMLAVGLGGLLAAAAVAPFWHVAVVVCPWFLKTFPGRILYLTAFTLAVVAGLGADQLLRGRTPRLAAVIGVMALAGALAAALASRNRVVPACVSSSGEPAIQASQTATGRAGGLPFESEEPREGGALADREWHPAVTRRSARSAAGALPRHRGRDGPRPAHRRLAF